MRSVSVLLLLASLASHGCGGPTILPTTTIVNGDGAVGNRWPWMVSLQFSNGDGFQHSCGGSLITPRWVLTAARCINRNKTYRIVLGEHDMSVEEGTEQYFSINQEDMFVHPKWEDNCPQCGNDIALIKLSRDAELNENVQPLSLPRPRAVRAEPQRNDNQECYGAGWGTLFSDGPQSLVMQQEVMAIVDHDQCSQPDWMDSSMNESLICAGGYGQDRCTGDSGGPLMCQNTDRHWYIQGVTSFGPAKCNTPKNPNVFTNVLSYLNWLKEIITSN